MERMISCLLAISFLTVEIFNISYFDIQEPYTYQVVSEPILNESNELPKMESEEITRQAEITRQRDIITESVNCITSVCKNTADNATRRFVESELSNIGVDSLDEEIVDICEEAGEEYNISPYLLESIVWTESRGDAKASNGTCVGLCGINKYYHKDRVMKNANLFDERTNVRTAANLLNELNGTYENETVVLNYYGGYGIDESLTKYSEQVLYIADLLARKDEFL
jgi:hypothetical protein